jgi:hypothetical protein
MSKKMTTRNYKPPSKPIQLPDVAFPKSFIQRIDDLAHSTDAEEQLFREIESPYWEDAGSPISAATYDESEAVQRLIESLDLTRAQQQIWEQAIGDLTITTRSAAFACGLAAANVVSSMLFANGKKVIP